MQGNTAAPAHSVTTDEDKCSNTHSEIGSFFYLLKSSNIFSKFYESNDCINNSIKFLEIVRKVNTSEPKT